MVNGGRKLNSFNVAASRGSTLAGFGALTCLALVSASAFAVGIDKQVSDVCHTSTDAAFRAKYCSAAKDYKKGYVANRSSSAIWGGVTTICGLACGKVGAGPLTCKISSMAGSAGEGILTKKFTDALKGEATKYAGDLTSKTVTGATNSAQSGTTTGAATTGTTEAGTNAAGGKVNGDACMVAGTSALKSYEKISNSKQNEKSISELRDQTKGMNVAKSGDPLFNGGAPKVDIGSETVNAATAGNEICGTNALKTAKGSIACATSMDPTLPGFVKTGEFLKDIEKATGKSADEFFAGFESPAQSLLSAPGISGLGSAAQTEVAESLALIDQYSAQKVAGKFGGSSGETYHAAGAAKSTAGGSDDFDVNGALKDALGQLKGGEKGEAENADGVASAEIAGNRAPASAVNPEDRTINIFSRVGWRYRALSVRDHLGVEK